MNLPESDIEPEVSSLLHALGLLDAVHGFSWIGGSVHEKVLSLTLQEPEGLVVVRVVSADCEERVFFRSASFGWSYGSESTADDQVAVRALERIRSCVEQRDRGGLSLPEPAVEEAEEHEPLAVEDEDWGVDPVPPTDDPFKLIEVHHSDLKSVDSDLLAGINSGQLDGIVIKGVYSAEAMSIIEERLYETRGEGPWKMFRMTSRPDQQQPFIKGDVLIPTSYQREGAILDNYFARSSAFREQCRQLFSRSDDFEGRMQTLLEKISGGRPVGLPPMPPGSSYIPATIRALPKGAELAVHVGNHFRNHAAYDDLRQKADLSNQLSYFLTIAPAESGGELVIYRHRYDDEVAYVADTDEPELSQFDDESVAVRIKPDAGDVIVFDGGRYYHRVTPVESDRWRWTMGGFLAFSTNHESIFFWS